MTAGINQYSSPVEKIPQGTNGKARDKAAEAEARERQLAAQNNDAGRAVREKIPQQEKGKARDQAVIDACFRLKRAQAAGLKRGPLSQAETTGSDYAAALEEEARERQAQAGASAAPGKTLPEKIPEASNGDARDQAAALDVLPVLEAEARERQLAQLKQNQDTVPEKIPEREKGDSRDQAAEAVGTNGPPYSFASAGATLEKSFRGDFSTVTPLRTRALRSPPEQIPEGSNVTPLRARALRWAIWDQLVPCRHSPTRAGATLPRLCGGDQAGGASS